MQPLVSIIIPSYNRADLIGETIESIIAQTYKNWECVIVDDGSTDNSFEVINALAKKDSRIRFHKRPESKPKGANACRNYGLELSNGEYINWLDSDDIFHPMKLEKQIMKIIEDKVFFSICKSYVFENSITDNKELILKSKDVKTDDPFNDFISKRIIIPIQAPIFQKDFIINNKFFFDESLQAGQEWELFARIFQKYADYSSINEPLDYIRNHSNNISNKTSSEKYWHYYLARNMLENKLEGNLCQKSKDILNIFYLFIFKRFTRLGSFKYAEVVYKEKIKKVEKLTNKEKRLLRFGLLSHKLFSRGDFFLSKVSLYK
ncbi:glycosyltransferase family 2 protein [Winogradskyella jejuensis]|uniref:Glycosyltransferase involved in cell wall bisynthesis n=1 Tax=Winogradskyella jejuensis TaxID=1089305 RepID=A0A1M5SJK5_9FLAO|nr:glycosyltransferase family 2 protein [Winogradskyella jejuensis]SHH38669.1 Glycosyltransferase involved in cell wall bisynthesis [Winogradskyella jejuensis]